jgi:vitamin B12 transporter
MFEKPTRLHLTSGVSARALTLAAAIVSQPLAAMAQLSTSPAPVQVPEVAVTAPAESGAIRRPTRPVKAPTAAEQSSTPRSAAKASSAEAGQPAPGAAEAASPDTIDPASLAVAPTGTSEPVETIGSSVTVITAAEIDAQQRRTGNEILKSVPGVNVVQTGGAGGLTSVFIRGTNSNHTKVLIDGIDVSDPSSANRSYNFGLLTAFDLDRVEVLRGPQSGLYGSDALGGVVVIYSKKGEGPLKVEALTEGGSFGTFNQAVAARGSSGGFNYAFNLSHYRVGDVPVTPKESLLPGVPRLNSSYENTTASTKLGFDLSPEVTLNFAGRFTNSGYGFQSDSPDANFNFYADGTKSTQKTDQFYTRSEAVWRALGGRVTSYFGINTTDISTTNFSPSSGNTFSDGQRVKVDWRSVVQVSRGVVVTAGADSQKEELQNDTVAVSEASRGGYVQAQLEPLPNLFLVGNLRRDDNDVFGGATTWRFAPAYLLEATGTKFKGSVGTAFKAPALSQRYQDDPANFFVANPNLVPEESTGYDIGFEQALFGNRAQFGATYFYNDITNLIKFKFDPDLGAFTLVNIGRGKTSGMEVFASADVSDALRLRGDYTYTEAFNADTGAELVRTPRHKATISAGWKPSAPLLLSASATYVGPSRDFDRVSSADVILAGFTVVNLAADYKLNETVNLFGRIDNVFDRRYQNPAGFEATGIGAYVGVKLHN